MTATIEKASEILGPGFRAIAADGAMALDELKLSTDANVLDVGTGEANFAIYLALAGFDVVTGEPDTDESRYAGHDWEENAERLGVREKIHFQTLDGNAIPFANEAFDAIFYFGVLHHIDEPLRDGVFLETLRVSKKGGAIVFFEPKRETLERVWQTDPSHPHAADPSKYAPEEVVLESKTVGSVVDIYIFRRRGAT